MGITILFGVISFALLVLVAFLIFVVIKARDRERSLRVESRTETDRLRTLNY